MSMAMVSLVFAVLVLPSATTAAVTTARRNCSDTCGEMYIPYPFGLGPSCSLPGFSLTCAGNTSYPLLGNLPILAFSDYYNQLQARISYSVKMIPGVRDYFVHWEAPARHFAVSVGWSYMFIVGCGVKASLFVGNSTVEVGNCSVICFEARIMEKLPKDSCDDGIGCCLIGISVDLKAFTLNISRTSDSARSNKVYAFISEDTDQIFMPFDALRSILPAGPQFNPSATLEWAIPYQPNCERAMEDTASYACAADHSVCVNSPIGGYYCCCDNENLYDENLYVGNPYINGGCPEFQPPPSSPPPPAPPAVYGRVPPSRRGRIVPPSIQPRKDCPTLCGNVSIPFPFGTKLGCFATEQFYLKCRRTLPGTVLPVLERNGRLVVTNISIDEGILLVHEKSEPSDLFSDLETLYALSGKWSVVKWVVVKMPCEIAHLNESDYKCLSSHSDCIDVTDDGTLKHLGYRCKCSSGFEGNPYIKDGCTDINECLQPDKYTCNGICHNKFGSYTCTSTSTNTIDATG